MLMFVRAIRLALLALAVLLAANSAAASAAITNGDFSDPIPLAGYTVTGAVIDEPNDEFGQLATDGTDLRTLEQAFIVPAGASLLSFDFAFSTEAGSGPLRDSFAVSVLTDIEFLDILVVDEFGPLADPSDGIEGLTGATPISVSMDGSVTIAGFTPFSVGTTYSGRISLELPSAVLGKDATVYFDLFDQGDGASTRAAVDNIQVTDSSSVVPEPSTAISWLLLSSLGILRVGRPRFRQSRERLPGSGQV